MNPQERFSWSKVWNKQNGKYLICLLCGAVYSIILVVLSRCFIIHAGSIFSVVGNIIGLDEETVQSVGNMLGQLRDAVISVPFIPVLLIGICITVLFSFLLSKSRKKAKVLVSVCLLILLPLTLIVVFFSEINGISFASSVFKTTENTKIRAEEYESSGDSWYAGFGRRQIIPDENSEQPFYIAGYNNGLEITDVLDYCEARAVWLDTGDKGILMIGIDCIALDSSTVQKIRDNLADIPDCVSVNVYSTHTHASIDTLGMWGPIGIDGKNDSYMDALITAATEAGYEAADNRVKGKLFFGYIQTEDMYRDSRDPQVYDENLYQLRFMADENEEDNIRFLFYGAHPEALRGSNTLLSRDYAGVLCDEVTKETGDNTIFAPGAIGGLIMTKELFETGSKTGAINNLIYTSDRLIDYTLSITEDMEEELSPTLTFNSSNCVVPMDNTAFWLYKTLGILNNRAVKTDSATGYGVETEVAVLQLGDVAVALIPGEIFPELVYGGEYGDAGSQDENPVPLAQIARENGIENLLVIGLANDEIGYIVPPSDFLINEGNPYFEKIEDYKGENHYEETNSIGPKCAEVIASTFEACVE